MVAETDSVLGSSQAFVELFNSERSALHRVALGLTRRHADAADLVQDTLERALRAAPAGLCRQAARAWFLATLKNLFIDRQRSARRHPHVPLDEEMTIPAAGPTLESQQWRIVDDTVLASCIEALDLRLREVYRLRAEQGLSLQAIAARLGIPAATAGTRIFRAKRRLQASLSQYAAESGQRPKRTIRGSLSLETVSPEARPIAARAGANPTATATAAGVRPEQKRGQRTLRRRTALHSAHADRTGVGWRGIAMGLLRHQGSGVFCTLDAEHVIGRSPRAALQLDRTFVSAQHASLRWRGDGWDIKDLGSRNGTFVGDAAVGPGQSQRLDRGAQIAFGRGEETWILVDDSPPQAALTCLGEPSDPIVVQGHILALPSAEDPLVTILASADGGWTIEREDSSSALVTGQEFAVGEHRWRFFCPTSSAPSSTTEWPDLHGLASSRLHFRVSLDEEYVELSVVRGRETIQLGSREHNYLLLHLARRRQQDSSAGAPAGACGWFYQDELLDAFNIAAERLNVDVYRIRKQFVAAIGKEGGGIVERRPKSKQLRIGLPLITIERI